MQRLRASALCHHQELWLVVQLEDPVSRKIYTLPPGGEIQENETASVAAIRETLEETGYAVTVDETSQFSVDYDFVWGGKTYQCRTQFFLAALSENSSSVPEALPTPDREKIILKQKWVSKKELKEGLSFHPVLSKELIAWIERNGF